MYRTTVKDPRLEDTWKDHPPDILVSASPPVGGKGFIAEPESTPAANHVAGGASTKAEGEATAATDEFKSSPDKVSHVGGLASGTAYAAQTTNTSVPVASVAAPRKRAGGGSGGSSGGGSDSESSDGKGGGGFPHQHLLIRAREIQEGILASLEDPRFEAAAKRAATLQGAVLASGHDAVGGRPHAKGFTSQPASTCRTTRTASVIRRTVG